MATEERQRTNAVNRLYEIRKQIFSDEFTSLSKKQLLALRSELNSACLQAGGTERYMAIFRDCDSKIGARLEAFRATRRFRIQIALTLAILGIAVWNLVKPYV